MAYFGAYRQVPGERFRFHPVADKYFTDAEFVKWYQQESRWIAPGQSVCDPQNHGGPRYLWVYFCVNEDGEQFPAGGFSP